MHRTTDDSALRAKVEEALTVYHEYVKTKGGESEDTPAMDKPKVEDVDAPEEKA